MACMKIEDIQLTAPEGPILKDKSDINRWRRTNPMDYFKAVAILNKTTSPIVSTEVFKNIYKVIRLYIPDELYKFSSLTEDKRTNEQKLQTLANKKIYLSSIDKFNDPFDSKAFFYLPATLNKYDQFKPEYREKILDNLIKYIRTTSLTENDIYSLPMWAHYSNNHKGYCVKYNMKNNSELSSFTFPIQYTDERLDISSFMDEYMGEVRKEIERGEDYIKGIMVNDKRLVFYFVMLCNIKHSSWKYEQEFRCTVGARIPDPQYIDADPDSIFIGMNCSQENETNLRNIGKKLNIPVHKMTWDNYSNDFKLSLQ